MVWCVSSALAVLIDGNKESGLFTKSREQIVFVVLNIPVYLLTESILQQFAYPIVFPDQSAWSPIWFNWYDNRRNLAQAAIKYWKAVRLCERQAGERIRAIVLDRDSQLRWV